MQRFFKMVVTASVPAVLAAAGARQAAGEEVQIIAADAVAQLAKLPVAAPAPPPAPVPLPIIRAVSGVRL